MAGYPPCWLSYSSVHQQAWRESRHSENQRTSMAAVPPLSQIAQIMSWGYLCDNNDMQRKGVEGGFGNTNALLVYLGNQRIQTDHLKKIKCTIGRLNLKRSVVLWKQELHFKTSERWQRIMGLQQTKSRKDSMLLKNIKPKTSNANKTNSQKIRFFMFIQWK